MRIQGRDRGNEQQHAPEQEPEPLKGLPKPTAAFRRRAWLQFQRAIDPLAPPKPMRIERPH
jgi:hypothetical protein